MSKLSSWFKSSTGVKLSDAVSGAAKVVTGDAKKKAEQTGMILLIAGVGVAAFFLLRRK
jgi:ribosomal protein L19